jgi:hypothetical protein
MAVPLIRRDRPFYGLVVVVWWLATFVVACDAFVVVAPCANPVRPPAALSFMDNTRLYGIPKMFRWLTDQYPDILNRQLEEGLGADLNIDNFYLDMNGNYAGAALQAFLIGHYKCMNELTLCIIASTGIIHPATHGNAEGEMILLDETAMFKKIFLYVDRCV